MSITDIQNLLHAYMSKKPFFIIMLPFSAIFAFAYPIYLLMTRFEILQIVTGIIANFSTLLYFIYILGLVLCFVKKEMLSLSLVFAMKTVYSVLVIIMKDTSFYINFTFDIFVYLLLAWLALKANFSAYNTEEKIHNYMED